MPLTRIWKAKQCRNCEAEQCRKCEVFEGPFGRATQVTPGNLSWEPWREDGADDVDLEVSECGGLKPMSMLRVLRQ